MNSTLYQSSINNGVSSTPYSFENYNEFLKKQNYHILENQKLQNAHDVANSLVHFLTHEPHLEEVLDYFYDLDEMLSKEIKSGVNIKSVDSMKSSFKSMKIALVAARDLKPLLENEQLKEFRASYAGIDAYLDRGFTNLTMLDDNANIGRAVSDFVCTVERTLVESQNFLLLLTSKECLEMRSFFAAINTEIELDVDTLQATDTDTNIDTEYLGILSKLLKDKLSNVNKLQPEVLALKEVVSNSIAREHFQSEYDNIKTYVQNEMESDDIPTTISYISTFKEKILTHDRELAVYEQKRLEEERIANELRKKRNIKIGVGVVVGILILLNIKTIISIIVGIFQLIIGIVVIGIIFAALVNNNNNK